MRISWKDSVAVAMLAGSVFASGCHSDRFCRGGSCTGSRPSGPPSSISSFYNSRSAAPEYSEPTNPAVPLTPAPYSPPSGSGSRSMPIYEGSGTR